MSLLEYVKERVTHEGDCWIWHGYVANHSPMAHTGGRKFSVRRELIKEAGREVPNSLLIRTKCGDKRCVNPAHFQVMKKSSAAKLYKKTAQHIARITLGKRANSKYSDELVAEIRESELTQIAAARKYGVSKSFVGKVRRGEIRKMLANPFAGLMR